MIRRSEEYQIDLQGAPAQEVFLNLRSSLIDQCELSQSFFEKTKDFLYQKGVIKQGEQQNQQSHPTILNHFTSPLLSAEVQQKLIEKFLCVVYVYLSPEYRSAFLENIHSTINTTLGTSNNDAEVPVFTRIWTSLNQSDQGESNPSFAESESVQERVAERNHSYTAQFQLSGQPVHKKRKLLYCLLVSLLLIGIMTFVMILYLFIFPSTVSTNNNSTPSSPVQSTVHGNTTLSPIWNRSFNATSTTTTTENSTTASIIRTFINEPYNFSGIFKPPKGFVSIITDLDSVRYSQAQICRDGSNTILNITLPGRVDIHSLTPKCSEKVKGLEIAGPFSLNDIIILLQRFPNLQYLSFLGSEICEEIGDSSSEVIVQAKIVLPHLLYLKFENLTECPELYKFFSDSVATPNLSKLVFSGIFMNSINQDLIENVVTKNSQIEYCKFKGFVCDQCLPFTRVKTWPALKFLEIDVANPSGSKAIEFYKLLLKATTDLIYLKSNIELKENNINLLRRSRLDFQYLDVHVQFNDSRIKFSVKSFKDFPNLTQLHFTLLFSNLSVCSVRKFPVLLTDLKALTKNLPRIDKISFRSNCHINAVGGWNLPCRDFEFEFCEALGMRLIIISQRPSCTRHMG